jgi:uncharacterized protein (DUF58 family)
MSSTPQTFTYLTRETIERFGNLELLARGLVEGFITGMHKSPHHGFSVEFAEYREYAPGDPIRHIDWTVAARNDRLVIRQYEQETNLRATVVLDTTRSLDFKSELPLTNLPKGGHAPSKFQYGCYTAAALLYMLNRQQDAGGLVTHTHELGKMFPPRTSAASLREMLLHLEGLKPAGYTNLSAVYHELAERLPRRSLVVLLTDLYDDPAQVVAALRHFEHRRHEVLLLHLLDAAELEFPYQGLIDFTDLETGEKLEVDAELLRDAVQKNVQEHCAHFKRLCGEMRMDYRVLNTAEPFETALAAFLAWRAGRK